MGPLPDPGECPHAPEPLVNKSAFMRARASPLRFDSPASWRPTWPNSSHGDPLRLPPDGSNIKDDGRQASKGAPWQNGWDSRSCQGRERELRSRFRLLAPSQLTKPSLVNGFRQLALGHLTKPAPARQWRNIAKHYYYSKRRGKIIIVKAFNRVMKGDERRG